MFITGIFFFSRWFFWWDIQAILPLSELALVGGRAARPAGRRARCEQSDSRGQERTKNDARAPGRGAAGAPRARWRLPRARRTAPQPPPAPPTPVLPAALRLAAASAAPARCEKRDAPLRPGTASAGVGRRTGGTGARRIWPSCFISYPLLVMKLTSRLCGPLCYCLAIRAVWSCSWKMKLEVLVILVALICIFVSVGSLLHTGKPFCICIIFRL